MTFSRRTLKPHYHHQVVASLEYLVVNIIVPATVPPTSSYRVYRFAPFCSSPLRTSSNTHVHAHMSLLLVRYERLLTPGG